jgi:spermidine synthase
MRDLEHRSIDSPFLPLLVALFVGSGAAALIYEIVWFQLLQFVVGSSAVSLAVLLTTFMGGMCLGSLLLPRVVSNQRHALKVYAALEASIGLMAVIVLVVVPNITTPYASIARGFTGLLVRGGVACLCLLPPTILMGGTLPAIARWVTMTPRGVSWMGFFYGGNIAGAVIGCLVSGFYLLRFYDVATTTAVGVGLNILVATGAYVLALRSPVMAVPGGPEGPPLRPDHPEDLLLPPGGVEGLHLQRRGGSLDPPPPVHTEASAGKDDAWTIYVVTALSGMAALGAEVVWTRVLTLVIGATVYAFSIILAVFLLGLGIGSGIGATMARRVADPRLALGACQWLLVGACAWAAWMLADVLPYWPVNPSLARNSWLIFQVDLTRCLWSVLPAAVLWGASFPLALAAIASPGEEPGRLVGGLYAANTIGAIIGAAAAGLFAIPAWGTQGAERTLLIIAAASGTIALEPVLSSGITRRGTRSGGILALIGFGAAVCVAGLLIARLPALPSLLIAYGRYMVTWTDPAVVIYTGDGLNSSIAVTRLPNGVRSFHVSGKIEASSQPEDMRLQRMLGHLPALIHPNPASVLVVGFGAGVTAGSFVPYPEVKRILIAEIEALIPTAIAPYFNRENDDVLHDPRLDIVYDDARHYVLTTDERFDVITSDPIHPWVRGSAALYTREYFDMLKNHLKPAGVVTQWLPLYESDLNVVRSELATFFEVFPTATVWANLQNERGYDLVLLGRAGDGPIDLNAAESRFNDPAHARAAASLREVGLVPRDLFASYAGRASDLKKWLEGAEINRDRNLRLQYLAGLQANRYDSDAIYTEIIHHRAYPEGVFIGSTETLAELRRLFTPKR